MSILDSLNPKQRQAASVIDGALLILAGAGSGKTRTITTRLAYLVQEIGIPPSQTLTLTFTNRAASEMRCRALAMIPHSVETPLLCTFHRFGLLFLRFYMRLLGRLNNFIVIDSSDQKKILRDLISTLKISATDDQIANEISRFKNASLLPATLREQDIEEGSHIAATLCVYEAYQNYLQANNLVDFDDLLLLPFQILRDYPDVAKDVSLRYRYIMVDEYQDTNELQNKLLDCLLVAHKNICVVGDDDQAIYGWRGANVDYILHFQERFGAQIVRLEENYRSTVQILDIANKLIAHNANRLGKTLVSQMGEGEDVTVLENIADYSEIDDIARRIVKLITEGTQPNEIAILFRLNAFSRSIEEGLTRARIPFRLIGTIRFYERREIKDYLAYFRFLINFKDSFSLSAIIDRPKRGVGHASLRKALARMQEMGIDTFYEFSHHEELSATLGQKRAKIVREFFATLETLHTILTQSITDFLDQFEQYIPLRAYYAQLEDGLERTANIDELFGVIRSKVAENPEILLEEILNEFSLYSNVDDIDSECVLCMSIHNSKGLEFEHVFVVGLEEGFFPLSKTGSQLEEERRLGYVACTRAKKTLTLSYVDRRYFHGKEKNLRPSRFLIEADLICDTSLPQESDEYQRGDLVRHNVFGAGKVESVWGRGESLKLKINFGGLTRDLLASAVSKIG